MSKRSFFSSDEPTLAESDKASTPTAALAAEAAPVLPPVEPSVKQDPAVQFRLEAEESLAKADRQRLEHIAQERGVTVDQLMEANAQVAAAQTPTESPTSSERAHVRESIEASDKADKGGRSARH